MPRLDKFDTIDETIGGVYTAFGRLSNLLYDELNDFLATIAKGGYLSYNDSPGALMKELRRRFDNSISDKVFAKQLDGWFDNFDEIERLNYAIQKETNGLSKVTLPDLPRVREARMRLITYNLTGEGMSNRLTEDIMQALYRNSLARASVAETRDYLRDYIFGDDQPKLQRYAGQIARDGLLQFDGDVNRQIQQTYQMTQIRYVGSIIDDSRPQCIRWVKSMKGRIPMDKLEAEIQWAEDNGSGMIEGTTPESFFANRGGYNCRHQAIPTF